MRPSDTSPRAFERYVELLRARTPAQRGRTLVALSAGVRRLVELGVRSRNPGATAEQLRDEVIATVYGAEFLARLKRRRR